MEKNFKIFIFKYQGCKNQVILGQLIYLKNYRKLSILIIQLI